MKLLFVFFILTGIVSAEDAPQRIPVPGPFRHCVKDAECEMSFQLCMCCEPVAMNKKFTAKYASLVKYCPAAPPPCRCVNPGKFPRCVKKMCELVAK